MITVLLFASMRDAAGVDKHTLVYNPSLKTVDDVLNQCKADLPRLARALTNHPKLMFALNQEIVRGDVTVSDGDEVALLPPVTGG